MTTDVRPSPPPSPASGRGRRKPAPPAAVCSDSLSRMRERAGVRVPQSRAQRWPERPRASPLWTRRGAQWTGRRGASRASLTDSLHLFEVNERSEWCELCNAPRPRAPQVALRCAAGRGNRGSPFFAYFSWAIARKVSRPRGRNPASFRHSPLWRKEALSLTRGIAVLAERCGAPAEGIAALAERCRDMRPAAQSLSFASPKESNQRKGEPRSPRPCASAPGNLRCSVHGCIAQLAPFAALTQLKQSAMSQFTKREMLRATHGPALLGVRTGVGAGSGTFGPSLRSAWGCPHPCPLPRAGEGVGASPCLAPSPACGRGLG
jgi:hypothetical protein